MKEYGVGYETRGIYYLFINNSKNNKTGSRIWTISELFSY